MSAHSPVPWSSFGEIKPVGCTDSVVGLHNFWCGTIYPNTDDYRGEVCSIQSADHINGISRDEAKANAAMICRAVNAHDELVAALRGLLIGCEWNEEHALLDGTGWAIKRTPDDAALTAARAVLAKLDQPA